VALALDPAGRLVAVVAVCKGERLGWLTLTDETTGTSTTVRPSDTPTFGGTILLTGPVGDPRPEGALDLLDRGHDYTLDGATAKANSGESTGDLPALRFKLGAVVKETRLKRGYVLARGRDDAGTAVVIKREEFVDRAKKDC
jgi:hypothetical protein